MSHNGVDKPLFISVTGRFPFETGIKGIASHNVGHMSLLPNEFIKSRISLFIIGETQNSTLYFSLSVMASYEVCVLKKQD